MIFLGKRKICSFSFFENPISFFLQSIYGSRKKERGDRNVGQAFSNEKKKGILIHALWPRERRVAVTVTCCQV